MYNDYQDYCSVMEGERHRAFSPANDPDRQAREDARDYADMRDREPAPCDDDDEEEFHDEELNAPSFYGGDRKSD